jgi:hypothetical protein
MLFLNDFSIDITRESGMSIETLTLLSSFRGCRQGVVLAFEKLPPFCRFVEIREIEQSVSLSIHLQDERTIWGELKMLTEPDTLLSIDSNAKACLAIESGSRRSSTETAILYALPAYLLMSECCLGLIDPQKSMSPVTEIRTWNSIATAEVMKDSKIKGSEIYKQILEHLMR